MCQIHMYVGGGGVYFGVSMFLLFTAYNDFPDCLCSSTYVCVCFLCLLELTCLHKILFLFLIFAEDSTLPNLKAK